MASDFQLEGSPIFSVAPVQFQTEVANICALSVANDILVIGFKSGKLFRIDLNNPAVIHTLEIPFKKSIQELGKIEKLFQDPTGSHLIITTSKNENFYLHRESNVLKYLNDLKNIQITAVGWNKEAVTETNTGPFLLGDKAGAIHEGFLEYQPASLKYTKKFNKGIYESQFGIDGIDVNFDQESKELTVLLVSGDDIAYWSETITKKNAKYNDLIFGQTFKQKPIEFEKYQDLGNIKGQKFTANNLDVGWITLPGIVYGEIKRSKLHSKKNIQDFKFLVNLELPESTHKFKSIALTKYHLILLRGQELIAINKLNDELVFQQELPLSQNERFIGISADYLKETYWVYSNLNIYEITVSDESKDIWKAMIENNNFEEALTTTQDPNIKDIIYSKKGDYFKSQGKFIEAARSYAHSAKPFETVALDFLENQQNDALLEYFLSKFDLIRKDPYHLNFKMQLIMLSSWVVELFIEKLNEIDDVLTTEQATQLEETTLLKTNTEKTFQDFLLENKDTLDKKTIYEIITSHNRRSELLYYANLINDFDFVLAYWIRLENWSESLKILERNNDPNIVYKYSSVLLVNAPVITVDSWLRIQGLDASKLLPAVLTYNKTAKKVKASKHQGIRFLDTYIKETKSHDSTVHDTLLYLLISNESSTDEDYVLRILEEQGTQPHYNSDFILRLSLRFNKVKSAAYIYSNLNFYEDAVNLALDHDMVDLAMIIADKPDDDKVRKFLWLRIAEKRISLIRPSENEKIKTEVKMLLEKCELITIKDLLPKLPNFTTIDNLKDEICSDLERFGTIINNLTLEMNQSIMINDNIAKDISTYKEKSQLIKSGESCSYCESLLTSRKFFIFPCNHAFHSDCLIKEILKSNDYGTKKRLEFLQKKYLSSKQEKGSRFINDPEVDALLSKKCPLCSDLKIDTIDQPFNENKALKDDWAI